MFEDVAHLPKRQNIMRAITMWESAERYVTTLETSAQSATLARSL